LRDRTLWRWLAAWISASVLGAVNGATRELVYKDRVPESSANGISVDTLIALLALFVLVWIAAGPATARGVVRRSG
jgi:hypothetical protein